MAMRELVMLQTLHHPCLSRLLTSFTFLNNIYLVLEYAKYGDLHSFLIKYHSEISKKKTNQKKSLSFLPHNLIRFILSEILTGLDYIHSSGYAHNDLKTENILIVGNGHIKITDFGACRPINTKNQKILKDNLISFNNIRDGHWRVRKCGQINDTMIEERKKERENEIKLNYQNFDFFNLQMKIEQDDDRCEGTISYLSPEKLLKFVNYEKISHLNINFDLEKEVYDRHPLNIKEKKEENEVNDEKKNNLLDCYSDYWSFGCIARFCFHGHPLFYGEKEEVLDQMISWIERKEKKDSNKSENSVQFQSSSHKFLQSYEETDQICEEFIENCLSIDLNKRLTVREALSHPYLVYGFSSATSSLRYTGEEQGERGEAEEMIHFSPSSLHTETVLPIEWPAVLYSSDSGKSAEDPQWARRQFSTLWAPLPSSYSVNTKISNSTAKQKFISLSGVSLISVEEEKSEFFTHFF